MNRFSLPGKIYYKIFAKLAPEKYAKRIGVKTGVDLHIYGDAYKMFGTEPWAISLGDHVHLTDGVRFVNHDGGTLILRHLVPDLEITKKISVGSYVYVGLNALILPGVNIGNNCIIAAGSVVTHDVPDNSVVGGIPAKVIKTTTEYLEKVKSESLHVGHLSYLDKDIALKRMLGVEAKTDS